jgi:hypothetical protein
VVGVVENEHAAAFRRHASKSSLFFVFDLFDHQTYALVASIHKIQRPPNSSSSSGKFGLPSFLTLVFFLWKNVSG